MSTLAQIRQSVRYILHDTEQPYTYSDSFLNNKINEAIARIAVEAPHIYREKVWALGMGTSVWENYTEDKSVILASSIDSKMLFIENIQPIHYVIYSLGVSVNDYTKKSFSHLPPPLSPERGGASKLLLNRAGQMETGIPTKFLKAGDYIYLDKNITYEIVNDKRETIMFHILYTSLPDNLDDDSDVPVGLDGYDGLILGYCKLVLSSILTNDLGQYLYKLGSDEVYGSGQLLNKFIKDKHRRGTRFIYSPYEGFDETRDKLTGESYLTDFTSYW